ncbi:uncharacterized protein LOC110924490 [Helianthus annuus]|uniref:uncharacterized protein LOC110924490 n=1 Tax=Helianthus annuus TaxID=4232 RepID=UPI000B9086C0|nr:uncharacterized protein LOC110924490 [Helianthus annuus]
MTVIADIVGVDNGRTFFWDWMQDLNTTVELDQKSQCEGMLNTTRLSIQEDDWSWVSDSSKGFSVRSIRKLCLDTIPGEEGHVFLWNRWLPKKVNIFGWRALMERLPTWDTLRKKRVQIESDACPLCEEAAETVDHLFTACSFACEVW